MKLKDADTKRLLPLLDSLSSAVEDLMLGGLTTASESTRRTLDITFREASRMRLLRLGSTLRVANEELGRFTRNDVEFSPRRLSFFLGRAWLLGQGLARAIRQQDEKTFDKLLWTPASQPVKRLEVVTLGVATKFVKNAFCGFDFRLRTVGTWGKLPDGHRLVWSCIFPLRSDNQIPPEAFLHLPQKQKFKPYLLLEGKSIVMEDVAISVDGHGGGRVRLGEKSKVTAGEPFKAWEKFQAWDVRPAIDRIQSHQTGPFDLEVEMQEEVVLDEWELGEPADELLDGQQVFPLRWRTVQFDAVVSRGLEGNALRKAMAALRKTKRNRPPLFGLMHYQTCRLVLQPLATLHEDGPQHLMISKEDIDRKALLQAIDFTRP